MMKLRILFCVCAVVLLPAFAWAQATATGTLTGRVVDSSGGVLPGVTVSMTSTQALGDYVAVTDEHGIYRVANLPPATYEARVELEGFQTVLQQVTIRLGATSTLDFALQVGAVEETITVSGEAPIVDTERTGMAVNVNNTALTSLPISTNRRYQDIWALVPGVFVRPDQQDINPSVNSRGTSENSTKIDGMDVTDPFGGGVFSVNFNYDAIQDIQVKTLGAEAEDGARTGGFMSIVTKSGGNSLHGTAALFVIPQSFNSSNVKGIPANQRKDIQPDFTLGGPIRRDKIWFFGAYRLAHEDQTLNNAPVPREKRGSLAFVKVTSQLNADQRLQVSFQWDRTTLNNAVIRGSVSSGGSLATSSSGTGFASMQLTSPEAFGKQVVGGPLVGANYTWVMGPTRLFQFVTSWMVNKPQDSEPQGGLGPTRLVSSNPTDNIAGSLTLVSQEGSLGSISTSDRSMLYLYPSYSFFVDKWGSHDFKAGLEYYPFLRNKTSDTIAPVEYYFRPPGTSGEADILYEQRVLRAMEGTGNEVSNYAYERIYSGFFQDRWKPRPNISLKAGFRIDSNHIWTQDRQKVLTQFLPAGFPTKTADKEFGQTTFAPNFGIAYDAGKYGVLRGTAGRYYEWLDLGGGDGTSHPPYVLATDTYRASPRTLAPSLNQFLQGQFPIGVNYGEGNVKTYTNEFSLGWEKKLPDTSSLAITFLLKRTWDFQGADDMNIIRDPNTGAFLGRPFPDYDAVLRTYAPNYAIQDFRSVQFLYTRNFTGKWGMNANYWYGIHSRVYRAFNPTRENYQYMGFTPDEWTQRWVSPRHQARVSSFVRLPLDITLSGFYTFTQGARDDVVTGEFPLDATAPRVVLSNGRSVTDPFFNVSYPRAGARNIDMLAADNVHIVNLRLQRSFAFSTERRLDLSLDFFNLSNSDAAFGYLSYDERSSNFGKPTRTVPARVAQIGARFVF